MVPKEQIRRNLEETRRRMALAAERSGRAPDEIRLVAVTKTVGTEEARALWELGQRDLGENRPQELLRKQQALEDIDVRWHMIGHLQRNKVNKLAGRIALLHSLDSLRLAEALERAAARIGKPVDALLQVNVSGEATKGGFAPDELEEILQALTRLEHVRPCGLMTMAPLVEDPEQTRPVFRALREIRDRHREKVPGLVHLSMGMTQDFEVAIEEGADLVRIGTALFRSEANK